MKSMTKKTAFGIAGVAAAALAVGAAAPAMASTGHDGGDSSSYSSSSHSTSTRATDILGSTRAFDAKDISTWAPVTTSVPLVLAPQVGVGDVASGNALASGNDVTAPVASGNDSALLSGNDTSALNGSGNGNSLGNVAGNTVSPSTGTTVAPSTGTSVGDVANVNGMVDGILSSVNDNVDLGAILGTR